MNMKENMFYGAGNLIFEKAKKLRNNVTPTEMILWGRLKEYFPNLKFRRQHPVSLYIVDLYCHTEKLVIEIVNALIPQLHKSSLSVLVPIAGPSDKGIGLHDSRFV